jgi:U3 small nucleolar RNA-associated protein 4
LLSCTTATDPRLPPACAGQEVARINAAAASKQDLCIWALTVLPDGTIVSGDSSGATQFWDGQFATLLVRLQKHDADVLALAASPDGSTVFSAGIDSRVAQFVRVEAKAGADGAAQWAYLDSKRPHTHDVRALALVAREGEEPLLVSAGNDTQLVLYNVPR